MLTNSDLERERYESRRRWQLDYNSGMKAAHQEGLEEGFKIGLEQGKLDVRHKRFIEHVQLCQHLLGQAITPSDEFSSMPIEELEQLVENLRNQVLGTR